MTDRTPNEHAAWLESQAPSDPGLHNAQTVRDREIEAARAMLAALTRVASERMSWGLLPFEMMTEVADAIAQAEAAGIK